MVVVKKKKNKLYHKWGRRCESGGDVAEGGHGGGHWVEFLKSQDIVTLLHECTRTLTLEDIFIR